MKYELSHDTIARQVFEKASTEARTRRKVERYVRERYQANQERGVQLTQDDVDYVSPYLSVINITKAEEYFWEQGRSRLVAAARRRRLLVLVIIVLLGGLTTWAIWNGREATENEKIALSERNEAVEARRETLIYADSLADQEDSLRTYASHLQAALDTAIVAQLRALRNAEEANWQRDVAKRNSRRSEALSLTALARAIKEEDRETALRLLEHAYGHTGQPMELVSQALTDAFYQQLTGKHAVASPLPVEDLITVYRQNDKLFVDDNGKYLLVEEGNYAYELYRWTEADSLAFVLQVGRVQYVELAKDGSTLLALSGDSIVSFYNLQRREGIALAEESENVTFATFDPAANYCLTQTSSGEVALWNLDGSKRAELGTFAELWDTPVFSADGTMLLVNFDYDQYTLFDDTGQRLYESPVDAWDFASLSPDGQLLAYLVDDTLFTYQTQSKQIRYSLSNEWSSTPELEFSPLGNYLTTSSSYGPALELWEKIEQGNTVQNETFFQLNKVIEGEGQRYLEDERKRNFENNLRQTAHFSPQEELLLLSDIEEEYQILDLRSGKQVVLQNAPGELRGIAFSTAGQYILTYTAHSAQVWNYSGVMIAEFLHEDIRNFEYLPKKKLFITSSRRGIRMWRLNGPLLPQVKIGTNAITTLLSISGSDLFLAGSQEGNNLGLFRLDGELIAKLSASTTGTVNSGPVNPVLSPDGKLILTLDSSNQAGLYNLHGIRLAELKTSDEPILNAVFSPDSKTILTALQGGGLRLWSLNGNVIRSYGPALEKVESVQFSPNGDYFIANTLAQKAGLWETSGSYVETLRSDYLNFKRLFFSPDSRYIVGAETPVKTHVWSVNGGEVSPISQVDFLDSPAFLNQQEFGGIKLETYRIYNVEGSKRLEEKLPDPEQYWSQLSKNHRFLVSTSTGGLLIIDRVRKWQNAVDFNEGGSGKVFFTEGNQHFATLYRNAWQGKVAQSSRLKLWNMAGDLLASFDQVEDNISTVAFSGNRKNLLIGTTKGEVIVFPFPQDIYNYLKNEAAIPQLTPEQRKQYGID